MTSHDLLEIEEKLNKAEIGPWNAVGFKVQDGEGCWILDSNFPGEFMQCSDAEFCAVARNIMPEMIREIRRCWAVMYAPGKEE